MEDGGIILGSGYERRLPSGVSPAERQVHEPEGQHVHSSDAHPLFGTHFVTYYSGRTSPVLGRTSILLFFSSSHKEED